MSKTPTVPTTMRAWQYKEVGGGIENTMFLNSSVDVPTPKPDHHLVQILKMSLNPLDYKPAEVPFLNRFIVPKPAIPGTDFAGRIIKPASGSGLKEGQLLYGISSQHIFAGAALAEYAAVPTKSTVALQEGVTPAEAAGLPVAGLTAYQSLQPYVKQGSRVFINGGSGGTGIFSIQIAKQLGAHVTTSCSTANVELCKSLGADEVIDYKTQDLVARLQKQAKETAPFDHMVDNVGADYDLFFKAQESLVPKGNYVLVASAPSLAFVVFRLKMLRPGFLGGPKRKMVGQVTDGNRPDEYRRLAQWVAEKKVNVVVDSTFPFEEAKAAMKKLKSSRARGKIVVDVAGEA